MCVCLSEIDIISYEGQHYSVSSDTGKDRIEQLSQKLQPLKQKILKYHDATISLLKTGTMAISQIPDELQSRIQTLGAAKVPA